MVSAKFFAAHRKDSPIADGALPACHFRAGNGGVTAVRMLRMLDVQRMSGPASADRRRIERRTMQPIKTILVPTDFSAPVERALAYARSLADAYGATLHLLHVIEDPFAGGVHMAWSARRRRDISNISICSPARAWRRC